MKKAWIMRGLQGIPIGICIGYLITLGISLMIGDGQYHTCTPQLLEMMGSETGAALAQTLLCALLGAVFGASSVIWELEHWSIVKQTGLYFLITAAVMLVVAYVAGWMERSLEGFVSYLLIFALIFVLVWLVQYLIWRSRIRKLNAGMHNGQSDIE